ncbi:MBL fold metallo-hydrolase [Streptomyces sp. 2A115]|uniref:MBL fold metallo-hydrolase n=1 Tax=Streptomyces sp. 2A115 TaxID=3457439 RepID=UPI003FCF71AA
MAHTTETALAANPSSGLPGHSAPMTPPQDQAVSASALPDYAPVPPGALGPALNEDGYYVGRIERNLYWVTDSIYQAMFLTTRDGVVLVDAPPTIGRNLLRAIQQVARANDKPETVTHLIYSHSHADHIGASSLFGKDVVRIGHTETRRVLQRAGDPDRPAPADTFEDVYVLNVGGETLELNYHGPNHSPDNIFIYAPKQKTLMLVDVLYAGWAPFRNLAMAQDVQGSVKAVDIAMDYPWETLVGGHLGRLGVRADGELQKQYLSDLDTGLRAALNSVDPTPFLERYKSSGNAWAINKAYLDALAKQAADPVIAKYLDRLAGVDIYTTENAFSLLESLRLESNVLGPFAVRN